MNEVILMRSDATLGDIHVKQRIIDIIAVPWEQETEIMWRGEVWREVFTRGAFDGLEDHAGRVRVNREHMKGDTVGKVVMADPQNPTGLFTRVKIAQTPRGDETLALAMEDMISASVGYFVKNMSDIQLNKQTRLRRVNRAFLDHLSMVESPAYEGAQVLAVREGRGGSAAETKPLPETPSLDDLVNDDVLQWARERAASIE